MRRREFITTTALTAVVAPRLAAYDPSTDFSYDKPHGVLRLMALGAAGAMDASLNLLPRGVEEVEVWPGKKALRLRPLDHWVETYFHLLDREIAAGVQFAMPYREAVKALTYEAQRRKIRFMGSTGCGGPDVCAGQHVEQTWGNAIVRADLMRGLGPQTWVLSWLGGSL